MVHISQLNTKRWENTGQIEKYNSNPLKIKNTFLLTHSPTEPGENVYAAFIFWHKKIIFNSIQYNVELSVFYSTKYWNFFNMKKWMMR